MQLQVNGEHLDNSTSVASSIRSSDEGGTEMFHKHRVRIDKSDNGAPVYKWVTAHSVDVLNDRIVQTCIDSGRIREFLKGTGLPAAIPAAPMEKPKPRTKTFTAYVEEWLTVYKAKSLKPTTLRGYRSMLSAHLTEAFGKMPLNEITTADVQKFLNERSHLSHKTLKLMLDFMGQVFKDAMEDGLMQTDPTASRKLVIPSKKKTEREAISMEDFQEILGNLNKLQMQDRRLMALLMLTGMRRGEVLGLQWGDIDWNAGLIHVRRNVTFAGNQPHVGTPKTEKGTRKIPVIGMLREYLEPIGTGEAYIIGGDAPITEMAFKRTYQRIAKNIDLHGATPHVFRHSFLTYAQTVVTDIKTLQAIAGHADIQTTMNRYVHQQSDKIVETGRRVTELFVQKMCREGSPQTVENTGLAGC